MKKISTGQDSTLRNWIDLSIFAFGEDSPATKFLQEKAEKGSLDEEVIADEGQLLMLLHKLNQDGLPFGWSPYKDYKDTYVRYGEEIYVMLVPLIFGWQIQAFPIGEELVSTLSARTGDKSTIGRNKLVEMAEQWIEKYQYEPEKMKKDFFYISGEAWTNDEIRGWIEKKQPL